ncbi:hypothetical protein C8F01DRAFT_233253 [Mycena amicta]|nr:hypothetical protein C8F01DRAFT_233253 [Mycena amicta]
MRRATPYSLPPSTTMAPAMAYYPNGRHASSVNAAMDISATVLSTLTLASQLAPLPFLKEASLLALSILNTVRGAKDNKESFKALANDAAELVSAILSVYEDLHKDGLEISPRLKGNVEQLNALLQTINVFCQKHISRGTIYRILRLSTENQKITLYRGRLRTALDKFGLQSSISIHENVVEILKQLKEREEAQNREPDGSPPPKAHPFGNLFEGDISGKVEINTFNGNQSIHYSSNRNHIVNSFNGQDFTYS